MIAMLYGILDVAGLVLLALVALVLSAMYSGFETGLYVLNKIRLELNAESGRRSARTLKSMAGDYNKTLAVLLTGNNLWNYLLTFAVSTLFIRFGFHKHVEWYALAIVTPVLFIFGESLPKIVFQRSAELLVYRLAWFMKVSCIVYHAIGLAPLVRGFSAIVARFTSIRSPLSHMEPAVVVAEGQAAGALTHAQSVIADRVMHLSHRLVLHAMKPMRSVVKVPISASREEFLKRVRSHNYSRIPVMDGEKAVGILDVYDILAEDGRASPSDKMTPALTVGARQSITGALYLMQRQHAAMAIVSDDRGRHIGIVTIKDLVEEIVGELEAW